MTSTPEVRVPTPRTDPGRRKAGAAVATTGGSGTLLALIAQGIPDPEIKSWLVPLAPGIVAIISLALLYAKECWAEKRMIAEAKRTEEIIKLDLEDSNTSDRHKDRLRKILQEIQLAHVGARSKKLNNLINSMN
ncbi:MAG: hypothetical protein GY856_40430 [bacterium]|nr:hypothetical protein [bacterium]